MKHKKFEYTTTVVECEHTYDHVTTLNKFGEEGWELCGLYTNGIDILFYFKREKLED